MFSYFFIYSSIGIGNQPARVIGECADAYGSAWEFEWEKRFRRPGNQLPGQN
jgi:hypothetical protein